MPERNRLADTQPGKDRDGAGRSSRSDQGGPPRPLYITFQLAEIAMQCADQGWHFPRQPIVLPFSVDRRRYPGNLEINSPIGELCILPQPGVVAFGKSELHASPLERQT